MLALKSILFFCICFALGKDGRRSVKRRRLSEPKPTQVSVGLTVEGFSPYGRVKERYNFTEIARAYGSSFASDLFNLTQIDQFNDNVTPQGNNPNMTEYTVNGPMNIGINTINIGSRVSSSRQSVVYEIQGYPNLLIKYQANCEQIYETDYVHPLIVDIYYSGPAAGVSVGPRVHYISPPGRLCDIPAGRCDFEMTEDDYGECLTRDGVSLRFIIMDRSPGEDLYQFKKRFNQGIVPFKTSLIIGLGIIERLEILHTQARVVHGDLHLQNILLEGVNDYYRTVAMKIIDYGGSFSNVWRNNETVRDLGSINHYQYSSWELEGYLPAARCDVAKAIQGFAQLMMPLAYIRAEMLMMREGFATLLWWKNHGNWFVFPFQSGPVYDPVATLLIPERYKVAIRANLEILLNLVRGMMDVNSIPPYEMLKEVFRETQSLLVEGEQANFVEDYLI